MHSLTPCSFCAAIITSTHYWSFKYPETKTEALKRGLYPLHMGGRGLYTRGALHSYRSAEGTPILVGLGPPHKRLTPCVAWRA